MDHQGRLLTLHVEQIMPTFELDEPQCHGTSPPFNMKSLVAAVKYENHWRATAVISTHLIYLHFM